MSEQRIAMISELSEGMTIKFSIQKDGRKAEGFVANVSGKLVAYENVCPHVALPLDSDDGQFFTKDGRQLICQNHGALFEPLTGQCVRGPCEGGRLTALKVVVRDGAVWVGEESE